MCGGLCHKNVRWWLVVRERRWRMNFGGMAYIEGDGGEWFMSERHRYWSDVLFL